MRTWWTLPVGLAVVAAVLLLLRDGGTVGPSAQPGAERPLADASEPILVGRTPPTMLLEESPAPVPSTDAPAPPQGGVEGTVTLWDGRPGAGLEVWLVPARAPAPPRDLGGNWEREENPRRRPKATTDDAGAYFLPLPPESPETSEPWVVVVRLAMSAEARSDPVSLPRAGARTRRDVRVPEPGLLHVRLAGGAGETPRLGQLDVTRETFWVRLQLDDGIPAPWALEAEGEPGRYAVRLMPGPAQVTAWIAGSAPVDGEIEVLEGRDVEWVVVVPTEGVVHGRVVDTNGAPLRIAHATWFGRALVSTRVDPEGRFRLTGLGKGPGRLEVEGLDHGTRPGWLRIRLDGVVPDGPELTLVARQAPMVTARVEGVPPRTPLRSLEIGQGLTGGGHPQVDDEGRLRLQGGFEEPTVLVLHAPDRAPVLVHLDFLEPENEHDLGTLVFGQGVTLHGRVVDADGVPVAGVEVAIADRWAQELKVPAVTTPGDGTFRFEHLPPEPVFLRVRGAGWPQHVQRVDPRTEGVHDIGITKGGRAEVEVIDRKGNPVPGATIHVRLVEDLPYDADGDSTRRSVESGADGKRTLLLCVGPRRLSAYADGRKSERVLVEIREGEMTSVQLVLKDAPPR